MVYFIADVNGEKSGRGILLVGLKNMTQLMEIMSLLEVAGR